MCCQWGKTCIHHSEPQSKQQLLKQCHITLPRKKKFKSVASAEKIMVTVVWVEKGVILVILLPVGTTECLSFSFKPPRCLKAHLCRFHSTSKTSELLLIQDNIRPHTSVCSTEAITNLGWTMLKHPPYSPDPTPSDYPPLGPLTREKPVRNTTQPKMGHSKLPTASS